MTSSPPKKAAKAQPKKSANTKSKKSAKSQPKKATQLQPKKAAKARQKKAAHPQPKKAANSQPKEFAGYVFKNHKLYEQALTHSSYSEDNNYERLEFLGDAILGMIVGRILFDTLPDAQPGDLSRWRTKMVCHATLQQLSEKEGVIEKMRRGAGFTKSRTKADSDIFEAMVAAVYLDSADLDVCYQLIRKIYRKHKLLPKKGQRPEVNPKTALQEWLHQNKLPPPVYEILKEDASQQASRFMVTCRVGNPVKEKNGAGPTKQIAEQQAAHSMLEVLTQSKSKKTAKPRPKR